MEVNTINQFRVDPQQLLCFAFFIKLFLFAVLLCQLTIAVQENKKSIRVDFRVKIVFFSVNKVLPENNRGSRRVAKEVGTITEPTK
jgi:hypothetical protein